MRILSGSRPTGHLHIGNYVGALQNWVKLQNEGHRVHGEKILVNALGTPWERRTLVRHVFRALRLVT